MFQGRLSDFVDGPLDHLDTTWFAPFERVINRQFLKFIVDCWLMTSHDTSDPRALFAKKYFVFTDANIYTGSTSIYELKYISIHR